MTMAAGPRHDATTIHGLRVFIQQYTLARAPSWEKGRERENAFETIQDAQTVYDMIERRVEIEAEAAIAREKQTEAEKAKEKAAAMNALRAAGIPLSLIHSYPEQLDQKIAAEIIRAHAHKVANPPVVCTPTLTDDEQDRTIYQQLTGGLTNVAKKALGNTSRKV
jgi:hypothetical protein